jgi:hypothetical protein
MRSAPLGKAVISMLSDGKSKTMRKRNVYHGANIIAAMKTLVRKLGYAIEAAVNVSKHYAGMIVHVKTIDTNVWMVSAYPRAVTIGTIHRDIAWKSWGGTGAV